LRQAYEHWMEGLRERQAQPYGMRFNKRGDNEYLYIQSDRINNGRSLGPRSSETEARLATFKSEREAIDSRIQASGERVRMNSRICRALQVAAIASEAGKILVEFDKRAMLGRYLTVVGTNAILAYNLEAGGPIIIGADAATDDFDLVWARDHATSLVLKGSDDAEPPSILAALKEVDATYTVNEERPFQLRNRRAYEVEIRVPPTQLDAMPAADRIRPATNLHELEWLLLGTPVEQVVPAKDEWAAKIIAPDPRMFALQKMYIADKPTRDALKKHKDRRQAEALLRACKSGELPRHPLSDEFVASIPAPLRPHWNQWASQGI
ncbi:MAG: GSU2403 family nucleotidyltransferase fold protein, partial [Burkholderiales bacterium]